jgi:hypothetical protein
MALPTRIDPESDLFAAAALPPGLSYESAFLSVDEETRLVDAVRNLSLAPADYRGFTARRRIASFGASYDFSARRLRPAPAMPAFLWPLRDRVAARLRVAPERVVHALGHRIRDRHAARLASRHPGVRRSRRCLAGR